MSDLLPQRVHHSLLLKGMVASAIGSLCLALISGGSLLRFGLHEAEAQSARMQADLIAELTSYQSVHALQRTLQVATASGLVQAVLVVDDNGRVLAGSDQAWVGQPVTSLVGRFHGPPLLHFLTACFGPNPAEACKGPEGLSLFSGWIPLIGGHEQLHFQPTPIALQGLPTNTVRGTLVTQTDLRSVVNNASNLASQVFLLGLIPLLITTWWLVRSLRRQLLPDLLTMAQTDSVSGVSNRRAFLEAAEQLLDMQRQRGKEVVVVMLDIDHFKRINDRYGHHIGDVVIAQFAAFLAQSVRTGDLVARFGGDEFAVVIANSSSHGRAILERLVHEAAQRTWSLEEGVCLRLTISAGMAGSDHQANISLKELLRRADAALYMAKDGGRAQMVDYATPPTGWIHSNA